MLLVDMRITSFKKIEVYSIRIIRKNTFRHQADLEQSQNQSNCKSIKCWGTMRYARLLGSPFFHIPSDVNVLYHS